MFTQNSLYTSKWTVNNEGPAFFAKQLQKSLYGISSD